MILRFTLLKKIIPAFILILVWGCIFIFDPVSAAADDKPVESLQELKTALQELKPGDKILIAPGVYPGGFGLRNIHGTMEQPIVIAGQNPDDPPVFTGRGEGIKVSSAAYVKFKNLHFAGFTSNGINIDDGGNIDKPSHHIILENITLRDIGPKGNHDAVKFSGVDHFIIQNCRIEGWGGSGIDLVGCHHGVIDQCQFTGLPGYRNKNGVQIKGGSMEILIQNSVFMDSGERMVQIGGSTGAAFFRPVSADYEAKNVIAAGNLFIGGEAQVAWVTSRNSHVHHNIFYLPEKYVGRILQETKDKRFTPSQKGLFEANLVVTDSRVKTFFNVGPNTAPETFTFLQNAWYDFNTQKKPALPTREIGGIYGVYPDLKDFGTPKMTISSTSPELADIGPGAYIPWKMDTAFPDVSLPQIKQAAPGSTSGFSMQIPAIFVLILTGLAIVAVRFVKNRRRAGKRR